MSGDLQWTQACSTEPHRKQLEFENANFLLCPWNAGAPWKSLRQEDYGPGSAWVSYMETLPCLNIKQNNNNHQTETFTIALLSSNVLLLIGSLKPEIK